MLYYTSIFVHYTNIENTLFCVPILHGTLQYGETYVKYYIMIEICNIEKLTEIFM